MMGEGDDLKIIMGWPKKRIIDDFWDQGWIGVIAFLFGVAAGAYSIFNMQWLGAAAGFCALLVLMAAFRDYFIPPKPRQTIKAPNLWVRLFSGGLAAMSAILWIIDGIPK